MSIDADHGAKRTFEEFTEEDASIESAGKGNKIPGRAPWKEHTPMALPSHFFRPINHTQLSLATLPQELLLLINDHLSFYSSRALRRTSHYFRAIVPRRQGPLFDLPNEYGRLMIFNYLQFYELWPLRQTCRQFRELIPAMEDPPSLFSQLLEEGIPRDNEPYLDDDDICMMVEDSSFFTLCNLRLIRGPGINAGDFMELEWAGKDHVLWQCAHCGAQARSNENKDQTCEKCTGPDGQERKMEKQL